jgi:putative endopeptidase
MPPPLPIDPSDLDTSVKPGNDFFQFVNGRWIKGNPIPPEESRWGSFTILRVEVEKQLKAIIDELANAKDVPPGTIKQKVRDFYLTAMDTEKCDRLGVAPLAELFEKITAIKDVEDMVRITGYLQQKGTRTWWAPSVEQDEKNVEVMAFHIYQGGLGLPDRDYYLNDDEKSRTIREKYLAYMRALLLESGVITGDVADAIRSIVDIETELAKASMTRVELRDVEKLYNKMTFAAIAPLAPRVNWPAYFESLAVPTPEYAIVCQPIFLAAIDHIFETVPLETLKNYLRWHVINGMASYLTEAMEREQFDFYGKVFSGAKEMKPRPRRVIKVIDAVLEEAMAQLYVERHFSAEAKKKVSELVDHLTVAYRARIQALDWMSAETKEKALQKLATVSKKLGYPDGWRDLSGLTIGTASYAENYMTAYAFEFDRHMKKIGEPVDRAEWYMPPQMVNACYQPTMNEILFPAAILQPPFFDPNADDAVNFGGIGSVIGHELTHGFDDQGALFDLKGNLNNWWTPEDKKRFDERTTHLAEQFNRYEILPGLHVNGKLTLGENIADLGGLLVAYDGLTLALQDAPGPETIDGLTPHQRFFIGYAIAEREQAREEFVRLIVQTDPHSPHICRVNGPLSNMEEFYDAFACERGDGLWREPEDRVKIW